MLFAADAAKAKPMAELVPKDAVVLLYRRYLRSSLRVPNTTIRHLLLAQIRTGFRRNRSVKSALAQRELIHNAHKDLGILEDERHSRTLYINRFGVVSCLEWEVRRTEWFIHPKGERWYQVLLALGFFFFFHAITHVQMVDDACPDITETVELMAAKMEVDDPADLWKLRQKQTTNHLEQLTLNRDLEARILETFSNVPHGASTPLPTMKAPTGTLRRTPAQLASESDKRSMTAKMFS
jgi:hypothetical protein